MTIIESLRREPGRSLFQREAEVEDLSPDAKDHVTRVDSIVAAALKDLEEVSIQIDQLRDEITLRAKMIGEATVRLDELRRKAGQGYGTIKNAIEMIRQEFAAIPTTVPDVDTMVKDTQVRDSEL